MTTFVFLWSGTDVAYPSAAYAADIATTAAGGTVPARWSTARRHGLQVGDVVYLLRTGTDRGLVGRGRLTDSQLMVEAHWQQPGKSEHYAQVEWDTVLPLGDRLPIVDLLDAMPAYRWNDLYNSGQEVEPPADGVLDVLWKDHLQMLASRGPDGPDEAARLLKGLIGIELRTPDGGTTTIVEVTDTDAIVRSGRSPGGKPVPIARVQAVLVRLYAKGSVTVDPQEAQYRAAFLGAVLRSVDGVTISGSSPAAVTTRRGASTPADSATGDLDTIEHTGTELFSGVLNRAAGGLSRGEQTRLRANLLRGATDADCALCGNRYPAAFLRAAHIKRRAVCSDEERRDLANIAMLACVFGCDALFELGYLGVDASGVIRVSSRAEGALADRLAALDGRPVDAHTSANASYYAWHFTNIADVDPALWLR
ncbi:hypothetical protein [Cryptosporangium aurantiacum]|uniref:HNH endonuclease n=1 Tax=Cryptosporangium aurantiacum TaxID=134849 RepID=A0A1M7R3A3_9ACTN|nr:hypothetical protein [Cryptosporangium aurantiacum]SHN39430.1 hypothetical protein SAMN05443668_106278 [Cryptosporangium aurantiacum]